MAGASASAHSCSSLARPAGLFFAFVVTKALRARGRPAITGSEELIGHLAEARTALAPGPR